MENLFENKYIRTEKLMKDVYFYFYFKRPLYLAIDTVICLIFVANLVIWLSGGKMNFAVLIAVPLFILIRFCIYRSAVTAIVKQDKQMHRGKPVKVQNFVTEESIKSIVMKDGVNEIRYSQIKKVVHTKTIIILFSDVNLMYVFDKDTFTKGTAQEFISFLKGKGIKVAYVR